MVPSTHLGNRGINNSAITQDAARLCALCARVAASVSVELAVALITRRKKRGLESSRPFMEPPSRSAPALAHLSYSTVHSATEELYRDRLVTPVHFFCVFSPKK